MKERPILFSTDMVKAILDGRKTQTRRVIKPQPFRCEHCGDLAITDKRGYYRHLSNMKNGGCPYGEAGDGLWVRETYRLAPEFIDDINRIWYKADGREPNLSGKWHSSIFMPRWASRITLGITEIRVERLQEITEEDAIKEGFTTQPGFTSGGNIGLGTARYWYIKLWDSLNARRGYSWETNPWVWVISFKEGE